MWKGLKGGKGIKRKTKEEGVRGIEEDGENGHF